MFNDIKKAVFDAKIKSRLTGFIHVVAITEKSYKRYEVAPLVHHATYGRRRPKIVAVVYPNSAVNTKL